VNTQGLTAEAGAKACLVAIRKLAADIGIPASLSELGVKREDIPLLARNALKDACGLTNPRQATQAEIESIFEGAM
jgi:alcohol dehydrogenase